MCLNLELISVRGVKGLLGLSPLGLVSRLLRGQVNLRPPPSLTHNLRPRLGRDPIPNNFFRVSSLAYPNLLGKKGYVVVVVVSLHLCYLCS